MARFKKTKMHKKILTGLLSILSIALITNIDIATANQIPAGYVLVPAETFFGTEMNIAKPNNETKISITNSSLRANDDISYTKKKYSTITATIRDTNNNPVSNKKVNLISSRITDAIQETQATTNNNGEAIFSIIAKEEGISSFTAIAENKTINERPRIVFLKNTNDNYISSEFLLADVLDNEPIATEDEIDLSTLLATTNTGELQADFPEQTIVNIPNDITVMVLNADGAMIEDFAGTITFASSDTLAILPHDYNFTLLDRGKHIFANAVTFSNAGNHVIQIDSDENISTVEINVEVLGEQVAAEAPIITSPSNGELLNKEVIFMGFAQANSNLAIFNNGQLIKMGESDTVGNFLIQTDMPDGEHEITVALLNADNSVGATSESINLRVDRTLPEILEISLFPGNKVMEQSLVKIEVKSEPDLDDIELTIAEKTFYLEESDVSGTYIGEFPAPTPETYFLGITLIDEAGNIGEYPDATSILVEEIRKEETVKTKECDKKIILQWKKSLNPLVANYRLDYGIMSGNYTESRILPNGKNLTQWEVRDLMNNTEYFFALRGMNNFGEVVEEISNEVSAMPSIENICATTIEPKIEDIELWQRKDTDGNIVLTWNNVSEATSYKVYAGTDENSFDLPITETTETFYIPKNLQPNKEYYFAVSAIYDDSIHMAATLSNVTKIEVGPRETLLLSLVFAFVVSWIIRKNVKLGT
jgi:hypothetical protein